MVEIVGNHPRQDCQSRAGQANRRSRTDRRAAKGGTGAEKRTWVFTQLRPLAVNAGLSIAVSILNLLIEAAVSRLNVQKGVV
ncbi:hypothetical protein CCP4SC76_8000004 [Gammaproteobacteria bacterium]